MSSWITRLWPDKRGRAMRRAMRELGGEVDGGGTCGCVTVDGVRIDVEAVAISDARPLRRTLTARARFARGSGPAFSVYPHGSFETKTRFGDVREFDERFVVAAEDEAGARAVWSECAQRALSTLADRRASREGWWGRADVTVGSDGQVVSFRSRLQFKRVASYRLMVGVLAELARDPAGQEPGDLEAPAVSPYRLAGQE